MRQGYINKQLSSAYKNDNPVSDSLLSIQRLIKLLLALKVKSADDITFGWDMVKKWYIYKRATDE